MNRYLARLSADSRRLREETVRLPKKSVDARKVAALARPSAEQQVNGFGLLERLGTGRGFSRFSSPNTTGRDGEEVVVR
jgi:hypothetical protein